MAHSETNIFSNDVDSTESNEFKLYVKDLPGELNEQGLLEIFNHYGHVKGHFYRPNVSWAFITYGTYREAETAIRDLNNVPPLRLKVTFARERPTNSIQLANVHDSKNVAEQFRNNNVPNVTFKNTPLMQARGRGNPLEVFKKVEPNRSLPQYTYTVDDDLLYPYPLDPNTYNPYENAEPYASTNAVWTRGQLTITANGKRHVSLGRGYTLYEIPDPDPEIHNYINKVHEKRASGLYEYGKDVLQNTIGTCKTCSKTTKLTCERCHTFYCSRSCQVANWQQHKFECETIPDLVPAVRSVAINGSAEQQTPTRNISNIQIPLRRPKTLMNTLTSSNQMIPDEEYINEPTICNKSADDNSKYSHTQDTSSPNVHNKNVISTQQVPKKNNSSGTSLLEKDLSIDGAKSENSNNKTSRTFNSADVRKIEDDISFIKCAFLSKTVFTDVRVVLISNRELCVQKVADENNIAQLMINLQSEVSNSPKVKPMIGKIYAVKYEEIWHRALVTSLNPLTVNYIDYGNDEYIKTDDFREINKYKDTSRFSAKIRLSEKAYKKYKDLKFDDVISVRMVSVDSDEVINVEVKDENISTSIGENDLSNKSNTNASSTFEIIDNKSAVSPKISDSGKIPNSLNKLKNIVNNLSIGEMGMIEVHVQLKTNTYSITLLPLTGTSDFHDLLTALPKACIEVADHSNYKPNVGDLICGQRADGDWLRGYILSLESPFQMAIIDEARIMSVNKVVACPKKFLNISAFGAVCEISDAEYKFTAGESYDFKVLGKKDTNNQCEVEIEITGIPGNPRAVVKPWVPEPEQQGVKYAELQNGSEICLTSYRSHMLMFARSLDTPELEHYNRVMQSVAKCAQTSPQLKEPPVVGQMVIAQYADQNFYRAVVTKIEGEKIIISYVDFGNTEITNIKKLKILNNDLKQLRSCATKIILKDLPKDVPMTKEVSDYLSHLVGAELPLTCTFEGVPSKDGVYLKLHTGEVINKTISKLLMPTSKESADEDKTCYMANDLNAIDLGKIGDTIEALVLHIVKDGYKYAMCPLDYDLMTHVFDIMPKKMAAYCESSDHYIPRENELCLALFEGGWYRAACVQRSSTPTTSVVLFVDFGNTEDVNHKDIRLMPKEFMTPTALASICNIINIAPTDNNGQFSTKIEKRISELVVNGNTATIKIIDYDSETGVYNVELPLVQAQLKEEGLISN